MPMRAAALLLAAATLCLLLFSRLAAGSGDSVVPPQDAARPSPHPGAHPLDAAAATPPDAPKARSVEPPPPEPADLSLPLGYEAQIRLVDAFGLPVEGAFVFVAPRGCGFALWPEATDAHGRVTVHCRGRSGELPIWLAILHRGKVEPLRHVTLSSRGAVAVEAMATGEAGEPTALLASLQDGLDEGRGLERLLEQTQQLRRRLREPESQPKPPVQSALRLRDELDTVCGRTLALFRPIPCHFCHAAAVTKSLETLSQAQDHGRRLRDDAVFADLRLEPPSREDQQRRQLTFAPQSADPESASAAASPNAPPLGRLRGRVLSRDGAPVQGALVVSMLPSGVVDRRVHTDECGGYSLPLPTTGPRTAMALAKGLGRMSALVALQPGAEQQLDFVLRPERRILGRAFDEQGLPLPSCTVEFEGDAEPRALQATTDAQGRFALADAAASGRLLLWPKPEELRLPSLMSGLVLADQGPTELRLPTSPPARARLRIHPKAEGRDLRFEARLLQLDTGRGAWLLPDEAGGMSIEGLAAGSYLLEVGAPGLGYTERGPFHVDGRGAWDLGAIELPPPGRIQFLAADARLSPLLHGLECHRQRQDTDILQPARHVGPDTIELPPGDYALLWRRGDAVVSQKARVESNKTLQLAGFR